MPLPCPLFSDLVIVNKPPACTYHIATPRALVLNLFDDPIEPFAYSLTPHSLNNYGNVLNHHKLGRYENIKLKTFFSNRQLQHNAVQMALFEPTRL